MCVRTEVRKRESSVETVYMGEKRNWIGYWCLGVGPQSPDPRQDPRRRENASLNPF